MAKTSEIWLVVRELHFVSSSDGEANLASWYPLAYFSGKTAKDQAITYARQQNEDVAERHQLPAKEHDSKFESRFWIDKQDDFLVFVVRCVRKGVPS